jgi:hypothetical protein
MRSPQRTRQNGSRFLVQHVFSLHEHIAELEIPAMNPSQRLDLTSSAEAAKELVVDASAIVQFLRENGMVNSTAHTLQEPNQTVVALEQ